MAEEIPYQVNRHLIAKEVEVTRKDISKDAEINRLLSFSLSLLVSNFTCIADEVNRDKSSWVPCFPLTASAILLLLGTVSSYPCDKSPVSTEGGQYYTSVFIGSWW